MFLKCPNCQADTSQPKSVTPDSTMLKGDIILCGSCVHISTFDGLNLNLITQEEFNNLTKKEKADLSFAVRAIIGHIKQAQQRQIIVPKWFEQN